MLHFIVNWLAGTPSFAAPYALAALGLIISERAGVLSLGAEGFMLVGALAGVATELELGGYPGIALLVAMLAAAVVSLLFAFLVVFLRVNQVIAGLAVVFFCHGLTEPGRHAWRLDQSRDHRPARGRHLAAVGNPDRRQDSCSPRMSSSI